MEIRIPPQAAEVLKRLAQNGFEAYAVGGCVRDSLLGLVPKDWDVTTSALPEQTEQALAEFPVLETGLKHGTVTVLSGGMPIEVTTYRMDGAYSDNRHPDKVTFTRSLSEDLARRDFTINAMACGLSGKIIDRFDGRADLERKSIRCVGSPDTRFREDALRILRALRFASVLGFELEQETARAARENRALLAGISPERCAGELSLLLCGKNAPAVLRTHWEVIGALIPELRAESSLPQDDSVPCRGWESTVRAVGEAEADPVPRLVMLLHKIGNSSCGAAVKNRAGLSECDAEKSARLAEHVLKRLKFNGKTVRTAVLLIRCQNLPLSGDERLVRRRLNQLGEQNFRLLLNVRAADIRAQSLEAQDQLQTVSAAADALERILAQGQCFSLKDLAVNGSDLLDSGIPRGPEIGRTLHRLLEAVMDGKCPNVREALLRLAAEKEEKTPK